MRKKILICLGAVVALFAIISVVNFASGIRKEGDYKYKIQSDGTVEIKKYLGSETEIDIPSELGGRTVTKIGTDCFENIKFYESKTINIPDTVTIIGKKAFVECTDLTITGCENVEEIQMYAFSNCSFTKKDSFPICRKLKTIGYGAFYEATNLGTFELCEGVEYIGGSAFYEDKDTINNIRDDIKFDDYERIIENVPDSVKYIGSLGLGMVYYKQSEGYTVVGDGVLVSFPSKSSEIIVPYGVKEIGTNVTIRADGLYNNIYIPDTVTTIEKNIINVSIKTTIYIPSSVTYIGGGQDDPHSDSSLIEKYAEVVTLAVEKGSYAEAYAKKQKINYEVVGSVSDAYYKAVKKHNTSFIEDTDYDISEDNFVSEGDTIYKLIYGEQDGINTETLISVNTLTNEKSEICKVIQNPNQVEEPISRIIGYKDGVVYCFDSNYTIYAIQEGNGERTDMMNLMEIDNGTFVFQADSIELIYYYYSNYSRHDETAEIPYISKSEDF
jgi:hypothetical protein